MRHSVRPVNRLASGFNVPFPVRLGLRPFFPFGYMLDRKNGDLRGQFHRTKEKQEPIHFNLFHQSSFFEG